MKLRSLLFVPGDSEKKFETARASRADALILDLEDSVVASRKDEARATVARLVSNRESRSCTFWVRINALETGLALADLAAVVAPGLDGIVVPKANGAHDIVRIGHYVDALETKTGVEPGHIKLLVVSTETPAAVFNLGSYTPAHPRLAALTWGAEDLGAVLGATANKEADGAWTFPYQVTRAMCLFAAAASQVRPIDTLYADFRDAEGLAASCQIARRDGFTGRVAIHPDQVDTINRCFTPSDEDITFARRVVQAFALQPEAGTVGIDGKMYDIPHLKLAKRVLASFAES